MFSFRRKRKPEGEEFLTEEEGVLLPGDPLEEPSESSSEDRPEQAGEQEGNGKKPGLFSRLRAGRGKKKKKDVFDEGPAPDSSPAFGANASPLITLNLLPIEWSGHSVYGLATAKLTKAVVSAVIFASFLGILVLGLSGGVYWGDRLFANIVKSDMVSISTRIESFKQTSGRLASYRTYSEMIGEVPLSAQVLPILKLTLSKGLAVERTTYRSELPPEIVQAIREPFLLETNTPLESAKVSGVWTVTIVGNARTPEGSIDDGWVIEARKQLIEPYSKMGRKVYLTLLKQDSSDYVRVADLGVVVWK
jgi:hypothetical protein